MDLEQTENAKVAIFVRTKIVFLSKSQRGELFDRTPPMK